MPTTGILNQDECPAENSNPQDNDSGELQSSVPVLPPSNEQNITENTAETLGDSGVQSTVPVSPTGEQYIAGNAKEMSEAADVQSTVPVLPPGDEQTIVGNTTEMSEVAGVVSSTTVDPGDTISEEKSEHPPVVESSSATTSLQAEESNWPQELNQENQQSLSKESEADTLPTASFSQSSNTSFQSAFAAFASASTSHPEVEAMEVEDSYTPIDSEAVSNIPPDDSSPIVEQSVTSAIDSSLVTTTQESLITSGESLETQQIQPMAYEQDYTNTETAVENTNTDSTVETAVDSKNSTETEIPSVEAPADVSVPISDPSPGTEAPLEVCESTESHTELVGQAETMSSITSEDNNEASQVTQVERDIVPQQPEEAVASDAVYFIQMADSSGEIVTSIIDPNEISSYSDSIVYKQCMGPDGQIETTIVNSGSVPATQATHQTMEETPETQPEVEQQVIYAHDLNGHLTPIDSAQSATDVAPPGKQFVYMQDSSGRIIRTIMDANQTMVPGQQVYYTQSEDGRIITSVMDSTGTEEAQPTEEQVVQQQTLQPQQLVMEETSQLPPQATTEAVNASSAFAMDNSMSGLNMLAELSHLTAGQASSERKGPSSTDSNSQDTDMDEFRPVAMITRRVAEDGVEVVKSSMANLKFSQEAQNSGPQESLVAKLISEMKMETSNPGESVSRDNLFVQWQNLDAMCWMDVVLVMLVYSPTLRPLVNLDPSHELASTLLITLLKANRQAQVLLQNLLKNSATEASLQTGAGNIGTLPDPKSSKLVCKENMDEIGKAINILYSMREKIWQALQPRLRCERGKHNSPVLVLPLLVREKPIIKQMFTMNYRYVFKCAKCGYSQDDSHSKILPTIPTVPADFNMKEPCFVRNCFECQAPEQRMLMKFEGLQDFVQMHFVKGLPHSRFDELSFDHNGDHYEVTGVVHYKNNPDHFIAWVRNAPGNAWMECDDLKSVITRYQEVAPSIPPNQVHMVMWERRLTPEHTLVMRDTEDTKYLASLVLSVQQPASSQTTTEASNLNQKRIGAPLGSTATTPSLAQAGPASTFLSGLISQSQSSAAIQSITSRGRGGKGSRGSRTPRGGITIRRSAPIINTQMATPRQATSTQIIRLPASALQGVNSTLRGSGGTSAPRYVLVGGNNSQSAQTGSTGTSSKVVVLRSQGGSGSLNNLSAAQLLQLLQRSGAIAQGNTRITTQITRPSGDGLTETVVTKLPASAGPSQIEDIASAASTAATADISCQSQVEQESKVISTSESQPGTLGTLASAIPNEMSAEANSQAPTSVQVPATTSVLDSIAESQEAERTTISVPQPMSSGVEASVNQVAATTSASSSGTIRTLSMNPGEPTRYIQIPNPSGGPNIMTQLVMKGGKMILVPVDKNTQAQPTSTPSIIRVPSSALKSTQLNTSSISSPAILQATTSLQNTTLTTSTTPATLSSQQYITIPGTQASGHKRTIQLITVPRGSTSSTGQTGAKTFIVSPAGSQTSPRIVTDAESAMSSVVSQPGNIVIRELKRSEESSSSSATTISTLSSAMEEAGGTIPTSMPTVSLLRDIKTVGKAVSDEATQGSGVSLLSATSSVLTSKPQESFKYILPGSNLHQMSAIQNVSGPQSGRAFTALSSSGTIIGGHLTPTSGTLSVDQSTSQEAVGDGTQTIYTAIQEEDSILRGRGRGRGQRGRSRGLRTRGRGRQQLSDTVSVTTPPQPKIIKRGGTISMLSADLRQVGGQIIESSSEDVDGVPVVSIPDFSGVSAMQTESLSAAESLTDSINQTGSSLAENNSPTSQQSNTTSVSDPLVITQTIPSIKGNHGFDILTQGILGTSSQTTTTTPRKTGISLLTGKPVIPSSMSTSISFEASKTQQSLALGQSVTQNEIETLIKAAQGAAKPPKPGQSSGITSKPGSLTTMLDSNATVQTMSPTKYSQQGAFSPNQFLGLPGEEHAEKNNPETWSTDVRSEMQGENLVDSLNKPSSYTEAKEETSEEERVVSVDESQVSAAERYCMPTELFQPDDESPEKPVKSDILSRQLSATQILREDLPSKLFQDSEISSQEDDVSLSPQRQPKSPSKGGIGSPQAPVNKLHDINDTTDMESSHLDDSSMTLKTETDMEVEEMESADVESESQQAVVKSPGKAGKRGRRKGRGKGRGKTGRKKSISVSDAQESPMDSSPPPPSSQPTSPKVTSQQLPGSEVVEQEQECQIGSPDITARPGDEGPASDLSPSRGLTELDASLHQQSEELSKLEAEQVGNQKLSTKFSTQYPPAVVYTRPEKNWNEEHSSLHPSMFNYKVLSRKKKKVSHRHPSLGPQLTSFTSHPEPIPLPAEKSDMRLPMIAIVCRQKQKPLDRPTVDPSKEPTVIPLVAEEDGDPACTGGSVVTSHIDGEVFTGVIVHQRREMADWSCGLEEEEDEDRYHVDGMLDDPEEMREYAETMWTAMCMDVGDFTCFDFSDSDTGSESEEDFDSKDSDGEESFLHSQEESTQKHTGADATDLQQETPQSPIGSKSPSSCKRSASDDQTPSSPYSVPSPKRPKVAIDTSAVSSSKTGTDNVSVTSDMSKKVEGAATRVNGISSNQSVSSHPDPASPSNLSPNPLPSIPLTDKAESFISPARRSSRTPVPSFKIRDYIEDKPLKSATKVRRSSALSSDDDMSGYNSGETAVKKGKKKSVKTLPAESSAS